MGNESGCVVLYKKPFSNFLAEVDLNQHVDGASSYPSLNSTEAVREIERSELSSQVILATESTVNRS